MDDPNYISGDYTTKFMETLRFKRPKLEKVFGYFFGNLNSIGSVF